MGFSKSKIVYKFPCICDVLFLSQAQISNLNFNRTPRIPRNVFLDPPVISIDFYVIYQTRDAVFHHISNTEKRVENTTRSGVFLTYFEVFDIVMKHCDEGLI